MRLHSNMGFVCNYIHNHYKSLSICLSIMFKVILYLDVTEYSIQYIVIIIWYKIYVADLSSNGMNHLYILVIDLGSYQFHSIY
jgi:hypothetical protein